MSKKISAEEADRIVQNSLRAAKEWAAKKGLIEDDENKSGLLMVYLSALIVGVLAYFALQYFQPKLVLSGPEGAQSFDQKRAVVVSIVLALLVLLGHYLL